ncbi:DUF3592 domain-containing protein [Algoriphagus sp. CAU 1675]|uniref:DUF3592 domain-containing protein n=1 Tax=Algoriphagus sp. CAU 1675 TaxID=3032597 RepID=UPI0023DB8F31|nr:DUF3592 domain-containing protein [Algoriphagus sp. CAU 1675]MDF2157305.1 DUF3592 domain-containing protein [Algoriphagus sp. CAU 1675]
METDIILTLLFTGFTIVGIVLDQKGKHILYKGKRAQAVIFKNNRKGVHDRMYYPVVRFKTEADVWITQELSIGYFPAKKEGKKVEVLYDPEDPTQVEINSSFQLEFLPKLFIAVGSFGLVLGILELFEITQFV